MSVKPWSIDFCAFLHWFSSYLYTRCVTTDEIFTVAFTFKFGSLPQVVLANSHPPAFSLHHMTATNQVVWKAVTCFLPRDVTWSHTRLHLLKLLCHRVAEHTRVGGDKCHPPSSAPVTSQELRITIIIITTTHKWSWYAQNFISCEPICISIDHKVEDLRTNDSHKWIACILPQWVHTVFTQSVQQSAPDGTEASDTHRDKTWQRENIPSLLRNTPHHQDLIYRAR